jgi:hypothetical protein
VTEPGEARLGVWQPGDSIVRRDVWRGQPKVAWGGTVVVDAPDLLALYMPEGSPLRFAPDFFGAPHPGAPPIGGEGTACSSCSAPDWLPPTLPSAWDRT